MWILKNSTNLLSSLAHLGVRKATSIETFDFSTLYTSTNLTYTLSTKNSIILQLSLTVYLLSPFKRSLMKWLLFLPALMLVFGAASFCV